MGKEKSDVIHFGQTSKICHKYFNEAVQLLSAEFMQTGSVVEKKCQNVSRQCVRSPESLGSLRIAGPVWQCVRSPEFSGFLTRQRSTAGDLP